MKKTVSEAIILLVIMAFLLPFPVLAKDRFGANELINSTKKLEDQSSRAAQNKENLLEKIKARTDNLIMLRIAELNKISVRIQADKNLSSDEKSSLSTNIQNITNGILQFKSKIDADTDVVTVRNDAKLIAKNYRVYEFFVPKMRTLIAIDNSRTLAEKLSSLTPKLQDLINNLKAQGKDVTALQSLLDDIKSRLLTTSASLNSDKTLINNLNVSSQNFKITFVQVRQDLARIRENFAQIRHDIAQMRSVFKIIITGSEKNNGTPSAIIKP